MTMQEREENEKAMKKYMAEQRKLAVECAQPLPQGIHRYGWNWPKGITLLQIEAYCFRSLLDPELSRSIAKSTTEKKMIDHLVAQGMDAQTHFKRMTKVMFPEYIQHPWADVMLDAVCRKHYVGFAGCSHIGKSQFAAMFAIICFLCDPENTLVLVTSTTIRDAKKRVWGAVQRYWTSVKGGLPGKLINSPSPAVNWINGQGKTIEDRGIHLIPADPKKAGGGASKVLGMKAPRLFLLADEMGELSASLIETAMSNLVNNPGFRCVGFTNPASYYDSFGTFVKPKNGWASINVDTDEWETEIGGLGVHFDGLKSPNVLAGVDQWPILSHKTVKQAVTMLGEKSPKFWQMYRGWWCPTGPSSNIFCEADIEKHRGSAPAVWLDDTKIRVAACDPSFTSGGDRTILMFGWCGKDSTGKKIVCVDKHVALNEDVTNTVESRDYQIARQIKAECEREGVAPENFALDATGAGISFASIVETVWSRKILRVKFGGKASTLHSPQEQVNQGRDLYSNRVSELWYVGLEYLRSGQIRGLYPALIKELVLREYTSVAGKILVESKTDMKARGIPSPDISDCFAILLALCRERLGMGFDGIESGRAEVGKDRKKLVSKFNNLYRSGRYA